MLAHKHRPLPLVARVAIDDRPNYRIAADAGMAPQVLGGILSGRIIATADQQARIAAALNESVEALFDVDQAVSQ